MRSFIVFLLVLSLGQTLLAQKRNAVYVELLGNAFSYSVNYDRRLQATGEGLGARVGANFLGDSGDASTNFVGQLNYVFGQKHAFELGAGVTYFMELNGGNSQVMPNLALQYRYQAPGGFLFRAGWSPFFPKKEADSIISEKVFWAWPGLSLGYAF
jgi:hypothetical protein